MTDLDAAFEDAVAKSLDLDSPAAPVAPPAPKAACATRWPLQSECFAFYGDPRQPGWLQNNTTSVACPWPLFVGEVRTSHILIHNKCAESLARVLNNIWDATRHDLVVIKGLRYDQYDGSYVPRLKRGGNSMSMHWFACAIDWDAKDNSFHSAQHLFTDQALLVTKFKEEGWIWGGDWTPGSVDAMHVQAARIHD